MPTDLFENNKLSKGEEAFISNLLKDDKSGNTGLMHVNRAQTLATLRLAKEVEASTLSNSESSKALNFSTEALVKAVEASNISNTKSSKALNWLTFGLFFVGICQVILAVIVFLYK